jgi:hypothetical protein
MIKKYYLFFGLFIFMSFISDSGYRLYKTIPATSGNFTSDHLGNLYLINDDILEKYDTMGNLFKTYNDKTLGNISYADVSNPLKVVVFYKEFGEVVYLDNMLAKTSDPIRLMDIGLDQASLVCFYYDGIWVYDQRNQELVQLNHEQKKIHKTGNLAHQLNIDLAPDFMLQHNNYLYLNNPSTGILVFDNYGTYSKTIPLRGLKTFQVVEDNIVYFSGNRLYSFNLKTLEEQVLELPDSALFARVGKDRLFLFNKAGMNLYKGNY